MKKQLPEYYNHPDYVTVFILDDKDYTAVLLDKKNDFEPIAVGYAFCGEKDKPRFNKKLGRKISFGRARASLTRSITYGHTFHGGMETLNDVVEGWQYSIIEKVRNKKLELANGI